MFKSDVSELHDGDNADVSQSGTSVSTAGVCRTLFSSLSWFSSLRGSRDLDPFLFSVSQFSPLSGFGSSDLFLFI